MAEETRLLSGFKYRKVRKARVDWCLITLWKLLGLYVFLGWGRQDGVKMIVCLDLVLVMIMELLLCDHRRRDLMSR